jgi:hypothetical protein
MAAAAWAVLAPGVAAQDGTPEPGVVAVAPDPAECDVEPRTEDDLAALFQEPLATPDAPTPVPYTQIVDVADPVAVEAITATLIEAFACVNAGNWLAYLALWTDAALQRDLGLASVADFDRVLGEAAPRAEDGRVTLLVVSEPRLLDDGRIGAFIIYDDPTVDPEVSLIDYYVFAPLDDGSYLIDGRIVDPYGLLEFDPAAAEGTPDAAEGTPDAAG